MEVCVIHIHSCHSHYPLVLEHRVYIEENGLHVDDLPTQMVILHSNPNSNHYPEAICAIAAIASVDDSECFP